MRRLSSILASVLKGALQQKQSSHRMSWAQTPLERLETFWEIMQILIIAPKSGRYTGFWLAHAAPASYSMRRERVCVCLLLPRWWCDMFVSHPAFVFPRGASREGAGRRRRGNSNGDSPGTCEAEARDRITTNPAASQFSRTLFPCVQHRSCTPPPRAEGLRWILKSVYCFKSRVDKAGVHGESRGFIKLHPDSAVLSILFLLIQQFSWRFKSLLAPFKVQNDNFSEINMPFEC